MGNQSASRLEGDRYQHLYSWFELLQLLPEDSPYSHAIIENDAAGAADDVTLFPVDGSVVPAQFTQVKWHVDHDGQYDFERLVTIKPGSKTSVLQKLHAAHGRLAGAGRVELCLLSNGAAHQDFGQHLDARTELLSPTFFTDGRKAVRAARRLWCDALGIDESALAGFCQALRFRFGFGSLREMALRVDERMSRHGLKTGENAQRLATDSVAEWIERGGSAKRLDRATLLQAIDRMDLRSPVPHEPKVSLHVHGWTRTNFDQTPTVELDWTPHFDRSARKTGDHGLWHSKLLPELTEAAAKLRSLPEGLFVDVRGKVPLTASLAIGAAFSEAAGFRLKTEQLSDGTVQRWSTLAKPADSPLVIGSQLGGQGPRMLVGIEVSAEIGADLRRFADTSFPGFDSIITLRPTLGPGERSLRSESDAVALALSAKNFLRELRAKMQASEIHLVLCCPAALALFIGHRLNALGRVHSYERTSDGSYVLALELPTG